MTGGELGGGYIQRMDEMKRPRAKGKNKSSSEEPIDVDVYDANDERKQRVALRFDGEGTKSPGPARGAAQKSSKSGQKKTKSPPRAGGKSKISQMKPRGELGGREGLGYLQGGAPLDEMVPLPPGAGDVPDWTREVGERVNPLGYPTNVALGLAGMGAALPLGPMLGGAAGSVASTYAGNADADLGDYLESAAMGAGGGKLGSMALGAVAPAVGRAMRPGWERAASEILSSGGEFRRPNLGGGMPSGAPPAAGPTIDVQAGDIPLPGSRAPRPSPAGAPQAPSSASSAAPKALMSPGLPSAGATRPGMTPQPPPQGPAGLPSGPIPQQLGPGRPPRVPLPRAGDMPLPPVPLEEMGTNIVPGAKGTPLPPEPMPSRGPNGTGVMRGPSYSPAEGPSLPFASPDDLALFKQGAIDAQGRIVPRFGFEQPSVGEMSAAGPMPPAPGSSPRLLGGGNVPLPRAGAGVGAPPSNSIGAQPPPPGVPPAPTSPGMLDPFRDFNRLTPQQKLALLLGLTGGGAAGVMMGRNIATAQPTVTPLPPEPQAIPRPRAIPREPQD